MTELAYLTDSTAGYVRSFRARIVALPPGGVVLDRTHFYPAGGGQSADHGSLTGPAGVVAPVVDVTKSGTAVIHRVPRAGAAKLYVGAEVDGAIDWPRRYLNMRLHTAQHLVSALAFSTVGLRTRSARMSGRSAVIDLEGAWPAGQSVDELAGRTGESVSTAHPVRIRYVPRIDWDRAPGGRSGLVPLPENVDPVRVVEIEGLDECPCGGTHLRSTAEIGAVAFDPLVPAPGGGSRITITLSESLPTTPSA